MKNPKEVLIEMVGKDNAIRYIDMILQSLEQDELIEASIISEKG